MAYRNVEMVDMIYCYGECMQNIHATVRLYQQRYPDRRHPSRSTLYYIIRRFESTGSVNPRKRLGKQKSATNDDMRTLIMAREEVMEHHHIHQG